MATAHGIATGNGKTLRFVSPGGSTLAYEERAWLHGEVETRADNWHVAFKALVWLAYPQAKAALNRKHYRTMTERRALGCKDRGRLRDALTQFDECGLEVACADMTLWDGVRAHRWREVFADRRAEVAAKMRFFLLGQGDYWIIDLDENYQWAVVGDPGRTTLFILSRTPTLEDDVYQGILSRVREKCYDPEELRLTVQVADGS